MYGWPRALASVASRFADAKCNGLGSNLAYLDELALAADWLAAYELCGDGIQTGLSVKNSLTQHKIEDSGMSAAFKSW